MYNLDHWRRSLVTKIKLTQKKEALGSKSITFTIKDRYKEINSKMIDEIKEIGNSNPKKNIRFCFHDNEESNMHIMLILERKVGKLYPPHKHKQRTEIHLVHEGTLGVYMITDNGYPESIKYNTEKDNKVTIVPENQLHLTLPISEYVIYTEIKDGKHTPFKEDCVEINFKELGINNMEQYQLYLYNKE